MKLSSSEAIRDIKNRYDFKLSKSLGQNFIADETVIERIVEGAEIGGDDLVIEIGPGIGVLTAAAAEEAAKVVAVEIDKKLIPILHETLIGYQNIEIVNQDIMKTDLAELIRERHPAGPAAVDSQHTAIIGNLPYYITTPILMKLLEERVPARSITVMMQKEVADRIMAEPGSRTYGALSATVQYYCTVTHITDVPKEVFVPQPKVDSTVIRLDMRQERPVELLDEKAFFDVIRGGFSQRRKTFANSLTGVRGMGKQEVLAVLEQSGIDPTRRCETLSIEEFACVANAIVERE